MSQHCGAYARYSSDRQSPASIEDQLRKCREFAASHGWDFLEEHVYTDEELSGAGADRPGYDNVPEGESVRLQVNEAEAAIVRRIFQMAAEGGSLRSIAKTLNREHVPSPRPRAGKQYGRC